MITDSCLKETVCSITMKVPDITYIRIEAKITPYKLNLEINRFTSEKSRHHLIRMI